MGLYNGLGDGEGMRTLMAVAAVLVLAVAGVGGYVMLTNDNGQDPGEGGAGETGPQYTDADMRWNYSLEEVPTNDGTAWRAHIAIFCPEDKVGVPLKFIHRQDGYGLLLSQGVSSGTTYHSLILPQADTVLEFVLSDGAAEYPLDPTLRMDPTLQASVQ